MKILHVLSSAKSEGTPHLVKSWLKEVKHEQTVLFLSDEGELFSDFEALSEITINKSFIPTVKRPWEIVNLVKKNCNKTKPDLVLSWPTGHSQWIHIGASLAGVKHRITHIGNPPGISFFGRYIATAITFWISYFLRVKFVACSKFVRDEYRQLSIIPQDIQAIYNSFDFTRFLPSKKESRKDVTMIGYMESVRDHKCLLNAWALLASNDDCVLNLIGEGSLKTELQNYIETNSISNVKFMGRIKDVSTILRSTKVYVLSTKEEGFGITLLEAMASGCRIVATDVPAVREVLSNGKYGKLVELGNSKILADQIKSELSKGEIEPDELIAREEYLKQFNVLNMMDNYMKLLE